MPLFAAVLNTQVATEKAAAEKAVAEKAAAAVFAARPKSNYLGKVLIKRLNKSSSPGFFFKNEVTAGALFLITKDADVTVAVEHGRTALHNAAYKGHAACIDPLVKAGAELEAKGCRGSTPLILAAGSGHADCIGLLLKAGAELKAKDENGFTARDLAVKNKRKQWKAVVKLLDEHAVRT
eukprot:CAMPEP_0171617894 /NCGR_PEP_ID=MMETSP0990-20121206/14394_1 /TAXON_ID=483369 /ORGANISM="non described non described, Strain CCMP2098" /LENGTH=179 /DNA_ID=CAMNT_0012182537 /DNA_START=225 /DNA_END=764 /DNA_ORIENTATION=-